MTLKNSIRKVAFLGDPHLNHATPKSRIDDFSQVTITKLKKVLDICVRNEVSHLIMLGDVFHNTQQPLRYLYDVIEVFKEFNARGIVVKTLIGNHDIPYNRRDYLSRASLGILIQSGTVGLLDKVTLQTPKGFDVGIYGFHYGDEIQSSVQVSPDEEFSICVAHMFFDNSLSLTDSLSKEQVKDLGYRMYFLGHDHVDYKTERCGKSLVFRPGSLMRGTSHNYNLDRKVNIDIISFVDESGSLKVKAKREHVPVSPSEEVFSSGILNKADSTALMDDISLKVDDLLGKMDTFTSNTSIFDFLGEMDIDEKIKVRVTEYLHLKGIYK